MKESKRHIGLLMLLSAFLMLTGCHYPEPDYSGWDLTQEQRDSMEFRATHHYGVNYNFKVLADSLPLRQMLRSDSLWIYRDDVLVVADYARMTSPNSTDAIWIKVARDQETIGWIQENRLLKSIVPIDPISQGIHFFSNSHTLIFLLVLAAFFLGVIYRAIRKKQIRLIWLNDIDSVFPIILSWLLAAAAVIYNSMQRFVPGTWERYYYDPSLNPFDLPFILGLFILCIWLILLLGVALLDDLFHQTSFEVASFYLTGLAACCTILYIFFTCLWIYAAYICFAAYTIWCIRRLMKANRYPYACGACGAKMRSKGICPHCGALNE